MNHTDLPHSSQSHPCANSWTALSVDRAEKKKDLQRLVFHSSHTFHLFNIFFFTRQVLEHLKILFHYKGIPIKAIWETLMSQAFLSNPSYSAQPEAYIWRSVLW